MFPSRLECVQHFGSEEYEPDARIIEEEKDFLKEWPRVEGVAKYFAIDIESTTLAELHKIYKPYRYGALVSAPCSLYSVPMSWQ